MPFFRFFAVFIVVFISNNALGSTLVTTENSHSFKIEFTSQGKQTSFDHERFAALDNYRQQTYLEDFLFLAFDLLVFCAPFQDGRNEQEICIHGYFQLVEMAKSGVDFSSLDGIYLAPSATVASNQIDPMDPYSDVFGFTWVDGTKDLDGKVLQNIIDRRKQHLASVKSSLGAVEAQFGKKISMRCHTSAKKCEIAMQMIRNLPEEYLEIVRSRSWLVGFSIVPGDANKEIKLAFAQTFSDRVINFGTSTKQKDLENFILSL